MSTEPRPRASSPQARRLAIAAGGAVVGALVAGAIVAALALPAQTSGDPMPPSLVVERMDAAAARGDWDAAFAAVDFEARGRAMVPDLWDAGSAEARAAMVAFLKPIFRTALEKAREGGVFAAGSALEATRISGGRYSVERTGRLEGKEVAMRFTLEPRGPEWRITDRRTRTGTVVHNTDIVVRTMRAKIAGVLGHEPDLAEFVANAPTWVGQIRASTMRVGEE